MRCDKSPRPWLKTVCYFLRSFQKCFFFNQVKIKFIFFFAVEDDCADTMRGVFMAISVIAYTRSQRHNYAQKLIDMMAQSLRIAPKLKVVLHNLRVLTSDRTAQGDISKKYALSDDEIRVRHRCFLFKLCITFILTHAI